MTIKYGSVFHALENNFFSASDLLLWLVNAPLSNKTIIAYKAICNRMDVAKQYLPCGYHFLYYRIEYVKILFAMGGHTDVLVNSSCCTTLSQLIFLYNEINRTKTINIELLPAHRVICQKFPPTSLTEFLSNDEWEYYFAAYDSYDPKNKDAWLDEILHLDIDDKNNTSNKVKNNTSDKGKNNKDIDVKDIDVKDIDVKDIDVKDIDVKDGDMKNIDVKDIDVKDGENNWSDKDDKENNSSNIKEDYPIILFLKYDLINLLDLNLLHKTSNGINDLLQRCRYIEAISKHLLAICCQASLSRRV